MRTFNKYAAAAIVILLTQAPAWAQDAAADVAEKVPAANEGYFFWGVATALLFLVFFLFTAIARISSVGKQEEAAVPGESMWTRLDRKFFTKAIPVEKEKDHLLDHDYDGIQELDNSLPPWWKAGFYFTIVVAVIYMLRFHVFDMGPTPEEEYKTEMSLAAAQIEEYRKNSGEMVDEKTVTMADAAGIEDGGKVYTQSCIACHGAKGEGGVGPNLTDDFWLHGGSINDVFKTIKFGVPDKGMQAWEKMLSPTQIKNIASYIKTLRGTNPPNGKAPQGDEYKEEAAPAAESTAATGK
ncbi:cbb3-type cytochrome c oxidase N-terminal domain-containing protein [Paracnuella aquatica]|uniref:cbb3-type cytochrome c oxidase N-terminal domain-containing protein n=1 Tax=Paracnuella aquatica TaxID=2268757 RepID=UPI000DEFEDC1|nr:cbb3-type cytochrome c oxidase N-terminal domain-containing protein [Paracnuella aquatica]RPD47369.1 cytochrome oxidase subunit III [Paracnuella aquatica]